MTHSLRGLERDGFVARTECGTPTRRVEYALTPLGRGLLGPLDAACAWTREHWDELLDAQEAARGPVAASGSVEQGRLLEGEDPGVGRATGSCR